MKFPREILPNDINYFTSLIKLWKEEPNVELIWLLLIQLSPNQELYSKLVNQGNLNTSDMKIRKSIYWEELLPKNNIHLLLYSLQLCILISQASPPQGGEADIEELKIKWEWKINFMRNNGLQYLISVNYLLFILFRYLIWKCSLNQSKTNDFILLNLNHWREK